MLRQEEGNRLGVTFGVAVRRWIQIGVHQVVDGFKQRCIGLRKKRTVHAMGMSKKIECGE